MMNFNRSTEGLIHDIILPLCFVIMVVSSSPSSLLLSRPSELLCFRPNFSPSSIVSGRLLLRVSGSIRDSNPPKRAKAPHINKGNGRQNCPNKFKYGANIPPIRATIEEAPKPTLRTTVGNCSVENK
ncbi:hypothetical protein GQX74_006619 [Glossina fuscipes]|nr:hypothetical protein GQX74_006619 [Glossina fuscipes]